MTAPNFCMLLRKHIANGRIVKIWQPDMERIIHFEIEHLDDLGDVRKKTLTVEIMGKHSNLIFTDEKGMIIDSIKHVSAQVSSVREVLPGRTYFIPAQGKKNPLLSDEAEFRSLVLDRPQTAAKAIYTAYTGISPCVANEVCCRAGIDADAPIASLGEEEKIHLYHHFAWMMQDIRDGVFAPNIVYQDGHPMEFASVRLTQYAHLTCEEDSSVSHVLEHFYAARDTYTRIRQKSADLRKIVSTALERSHKKYQLQLKQLQDTKKREKYKVYGELLTTYGYHVKEGAKSMEALNYYTNEPITVPLDPQLSPMENAKKYFEKYSKLKRTHEALTALTVETKAHVEHLESIAASLQIALKEDDLVQIRQELVEYGYIRRKGHEKKLKVKSLPFHYRSSDGFDIYIGKNNYQNEELTFKLANGGDWWFHAKKIPGSHVIVKTEGKELPDRTFEEAAMLAGYYSQGRDAKKLEIDYLQRKNVKKPNGSAPGFVVYYTNYSMAVRPDISGIECISD